MTLEDTEAQPTPPTRRSLRRSSRGATAQAPATAEALGWLDASAVLAHAHAARGMGVAAPPLTERTDEPDLLAEAPLRRSLRVSTVLPVALVLIVVAAYTATALLWPLTAVPPQIAAGQVQPRAAAASALDWPSAGSAAAGVAGIGEPVASTSKRAEIASITKVVTALLVLEELPLALDEKGPEYVFTAQDQATYYSYLASGQSALNVPVGGSLTEYQMLEAMLLASANNYADRLALELWPTDAVYAAAAKEWLAAHDITGITVVNPSGFDSANKAKPAALIRLAEEALANPVIAEIVAKESAKIPGVGTVENTNTLISDSGVVGVKTGTLNTYAVLTAKDVEVGETTVRLYTSVLGQKSSSARFSATRKLLAQLEEELTPFPSITAGTVAGEVTTAWGETVDVVAADDASVVLWNEAAAVPTISVSLDGGEQKGDVVGTLTLTGPLNTDTVDLTLADDVEEPSPWWRLTHPVELFGLGT
ncbi:MAG: D-alanyl-D-alanine carboxypeptidase [Microbacterium sp.]